MGPETSLGSQLTSLSKKWIITPPEATNTGPGFDRGSGGGARGCGFEERVGALARSEGPISYSRRCLRVCVSVCVKMAVGPSKKM